MPDTAYKALNVKNINILSKTKGENFTFAQNTAVMNTADFQSNVTAGT